MTSVNIFWLLFSNKALLMTLAWNCYSESKGSDMIVHRTFSGLYQSDTHLCLNYYWRFKTEDFHSWFCSVVCTP